MTKTTDNEQLVFSEKFLKYKKYFLIMTLIVMIYTLVEVDINKLNLMFISFNIINSNMMEIFILGGWIYFAYGYVVYLLKEFPQARERLHSILVKKYMKNITTQIEKDKLPLSSTQSTKLKKSLQEAEEKNQIHKYEYAYNKKYTYKISFIRITWIIMSTAVIYFLFSSDIFEMILPMYFGLATLLIVMYYVAPQKSEANFSFKNIYTKKTIESFCFRKTGSDTSIEYMLCTKRLEKELY